MADGSSLALLGEPLAALLDAMAQAVGFAADADVLQRTLMVLMQELVGLQLQMMDFTVQQLGRTAFVVVYINPLQPQGSRVFDGLRHHVDACCNAELGRQVRSELILTVIRQFTARIQGRRWPLSVTPKEAMS